MGKALLLRFAGGTTICTHNQLYGRWLFAEAGRRPDTNRQLRLALSTHERSALLYSASAIQVIEPGNLDKHPFIARAGLDILSSGASVDRIAAWIRRDSFARKRLGHLLLDQGFLAGVGNYLRSEIQYASGLHWQLRPGDLDDRAIRRLAETAHTLMWRSTVSPTIPSRLPDSSARAGIGAITATTCSAATARSATPATRPSSARQSAAGDSTTARVAWHGRKRGNQARQLSAKRSACGMSRQ